MQEIINVNTQRHYKIFINDNSIEDLAKSLSEYTQNRKALVIINKTVERLYGSKLEIQNSIKFILNDGEKEKSFKNYEKILNFALKSELHRNDLIIAIGGGVTGDLAGFVASTYLRGIDLIQVPTTLLACVDSSVGGKTAINTKFGKNLVGTFYQPTAVFCNTNFLNTLNDRQYKTGLAEILKYAFIEESCLCPENFNLLNYLDNNSGKILDKNKTNITYLIKASLELKKSVVEQDEKEAGLRKVLNFGHTYGHAIEKLKNYKKYTHGEAVAIGMIKAFLLAFSIKKITEQYKNFAIKLITKYHITKGIPSFNQNKIKVAMRLDKKAQADNIDFVLPTCEKNVEITKINLDEI